MVKRRYFEMISRCLYLGILALLVTSTGLLAAEVEVDAQLDREAVAAGEGANMTLRISGARGGQPEIPQVENLIIQPRGQSQQIQMVNGRTSVSVNYQYAVGSNVPGDYQIPSIAVVLDGKRYATQPLKLKVLGSGAAAAGSGNKSGESGDDGKNRFGFLTVELASNERNHVYVGEIAPVRIRAWIPEAARAQLRSGIQPEGVAFTLHNVSNEAQQTREIRDGKQYLVVTWFGGISATKAGKYPASLSLNATVAVRDNTALKTGRPRGGRFGDPLLNRLLDDDVSAPMIQKDVTLKSDDQEIEVRALPTEGRPNGFTGAVGEFRFDGVEIPNEWKTGEPQQIRARISGTGNFALMNAPKVSPADDWKTYPGKDEFTAGDQASFSGSKVFQFSAVPRRGGDQELALEFSFFDPKAVAYKTIKSPVRKIRVTGEDMVDDKPAVNEAGPEPAKKEQELIGQHWVMSAPGELTPLVFRPVFLQLLGVGGGLCVVGGVMAWLRRRMGDPQRLAQAAMEKTVSDSLAAAGRCAAEKDVPGFFAAGRLAIQARLGARWNQPAQAITLAEITARISADSPIARFFCEADLHAYGRQAGAGILPEWQVLLDEAMASLNPSAR